MAKYLQNSADVEIEESGNNLQFNVVKEYFDSGSNGNGNWIKYTDGTMICWGTKTGTTTLHDYWGQFERTQTLTITYPQTFYATPTTTITLNNKGGGEVSCYLMTNSTTQCQFQELKANGSTAIDYDVNFIAIGRWQ